MSGFVKVTLVSTGDEAFINLDLVEAMIYDDKDKVTVIVFNRPDAFECVKETPKEILAGGR